MNGICPCCGVRGLLPNRSSIYTNVLICNNCINKESKSKWFVSNAKPTKETLEFINTRSAYSESLRTGDRSMMEKSTRKLLLIEETRVKKYVVFKNLTSRQVLVADFEDQNLALAYVMITFGKTHLQVADFMWRDLRGTFIVVEYI